MGKSFELDSKLQKMMEKQRKKILPIFTLELTIPKSSENTLKYIYLPKPCNK